MPDTPDPLVYADVHIRQVLAGVSTIAMVGYSANPARPSFFVARYLRDKGFRVIPVNPGLAGQVVDGEPVYASLADIPEPFDMVDIFRNAAAAGPVTDEAIELVASRGVQVVWMQLGVRNDAAATRAEAAGLTVIMDRCPKIEYDRLEFR